MKKISTSILDGSWVELNDVLRTADEKFCAALIEAELAGKRRQQITTRIWSRFNRMRGARERAELAKKINGKK